MDREMLWGQVSRTNKSTNFIGIIAFGALVILSIYAFKGTAEKEFTELLKAIFYLAIGALTSRKISE